MKIIPIKSFGEFLVGREEGKQAYEIFKRDYADKYPNEDFLCDFTGIKILAPSYCDEVFGNLQTKYPNKFMIDQNIPHAHRVALDTVAETKNITFKYTSSTYTPSQSPNTPKNHQSAQGNHKTNLHKVG